MNKQIEHIRKKADWISIKLWPVLKKVSLEYCKNLWTILIRPLFEQLSILYYCERGQTNREKVHLALRYTFKRFTLLKKNVSSEIIHDLIQFDIDERSNHNMQITKRKWENRLGKTLYTPEAHNLAGLDKDLQKKRRILPKELQKILNLLVAKCPKCEQTRICYQKHMQEEHQILIPTYKELISTIERKTEEARQRRLFRKQTMEYVGRFINVYIDRMNHFLNVQNT